MWLLDKFLNSAIRRGRLIVTDHDGQTYEYGAPEEGEPPLHIRLTHRKAANHIARYPQVGAGEAFMWGWLEVEPPHDIRDLVLFVTMNAKREAGASLKPQGPLRKAAQKLLAKTDSVNLRGKARKNAWRAFADRMSIEEASSLATMLRQAEEMGTSLGQTLRVFSADMRKRRILMAEEKAMALPAKLTLPLIIFVFPVLLGVLILPAVVKVQGAL